MKVFSAAVALLASSSGPAVQAVESTKLRRAQQDDTTARNLAVGPPQNHQALLLTPQARFSFVTTMRRKGFGKRYQFRRRLWTIILNSTKWMPFLAEVFLRLIARLRLSLQPPLPLSRVYLAYHLRSPLSLHL